MREAVSSYGGGGGVPECECDTESVGDAALTATERNEGTPPETKKTIGPR